MIYCYTVVLVPAFLSCILMCSIYIFFLSLSWKTLKLKRLFSFSDADVESVGTRTTYLLTVQNVVDILCNDHAFNVMENAILSGKGISPWCVIVSSLLYSVTRKSCNNQNLRKYQLFWKFEGVAWCFFEESAI